MKTKLLSLLLAALLLASGLLVGCAGGEQGGGATNGGVVTGGEAQDPAEIYDAEIKNLNGHEFRFYVSDHTLEHWQTKEVYAEAPNGDKVNDAVFQRNAQIAQTYNCTIAADKYVGIDCSQTLRDPLMAGEYVCDFIYGPAQKMIHLGSANLLTNFDELENIDLTKAWWDENLLRGMNIGGKTFYLNGSAGVTDDYSAWVGCFNKDYVKEYDANLDLYQVIIDGKWTIDLMYQIASATWKDVDGDGSMAYGVDRYGWVGDTIENYFMILGGGITVANFSANGDIDIPEQPKPEVLDAWSKLRPLLTSQYREVLDAPVHLRNGLATFAMGAAATTVLKSGQSKVNMGIIPVPKHSEEQDKYYSGVYYGTCNVYSVPITVENGSDWEANGFSSGAEQCAYFLEAFGYYSHIILKPAFYEQVMLKQNATDDQSAQIVELSLENKIYDPVYGYLWGGLGASFVQSGSGEKGQPNTDLNYDNLVALYTSRVKSARKAMNTYIEAINIQEVI